MNLSEFTQTAKTWINPPFPGRGKSAVLGFVIGFFLGPIGVGFFLKSFVDFALSLFAVIALVLFMGASETSQLLGWLLAGLWVVGRIHLDNHRSRVALGLVNPTRQPPADRARTVGSPANA